jgi:hypothetical protein
MSNMSESKNIIKLIEANIDKLSRIEKDNIVKQIVDHNNKETDAIVDNNPDAKLKIALKIVNKILDNCGKQHIDDLTNFVNVDRQDIIKKENNDYVKEIEDEIFTHFDKKKCNYHQRDNIKNIILSYLRGITDDIGFDFTYIEKMINNGEKRKKHMIYSIKNK